MAKVHARRLEAKAKRIRSQLVALGSERVWRELIPIWRQPGWTTPAEFMLVDGVLDGILAQTQALARLQQVALRGSRAVR